MSLFRKEHSMKKYISFADAVRALAITAVTSEITPEHVRALSILDPEFKNAVEDLHTLFANSIFETKDEPTLETVTTTSFTDSQDEDNHSKEEKKPVVKKRTSSKKKTTKKKASSKNEKSDELITDIPEGFYQHPTYKTIYASRDGRFIVNNKAQEPHNSGGYRRIYDVKEDKTFVAARMVYECVTGSVTLEYIKYKDGNRKNIAFDNLYASPYRSDHGPFSDDQVYDVSEKIKEYALKKLPLDEIINNTASDVGVTARGVRSIVNGNYSKISGKFFYVGPGKTIIPVSHYGITEKSETPETTPVETTKATETTETPKTTEETKTEKKLPNSPCIEVLNKGLQAGINAFDSKYLRGEELTKADMIIPVIRYMFNTDGSHRNIKEIATLITKEYGPEIVPDVTFITDVMQGRFGKNVLEAAFRK